MKTCERPGCDETFTPPPSKRTGARRQRFCSRKCKGHSSTGMAEWTIKNGGKIPADVFLPEMREAAPAMDVRTLARRINIKEDSLLKALGRDEIDFDLCDLILCKLGAVHRWWAGPLGEFYWSVAL